MQNILLIQNSTTESTAIRHALINSHDESFRVLTARHCAAALRVLAKQTMLTCDDADHIAAVLVDLSLPDSNGMETFARIIKAAPDIPILILTSADDEEAAKLAVKEGAYEYLLKDRLDTYLLPKAVGHMIERAASRETLFAEKERAQVTLDSIGDAVVSTDVAGRVTYLNIVAERLTGWSQKDAAGRQLAEVLHIIDGDSIGNLTSSCVLVSREGIEFPIENSSAPIRDRRGQIIGAVIVFHDVSVARAATLRIFHLAQHDSLTGLPNRALLKARLTEAVQLANRYQRSLAVLFLDVDRFKYINDTLGHLLGDRLLQSIAERILSCVRASDTVSRQGGDEFAILLSELTHREDATVCADKILEALRAPHRIDGHDLYITGSIGIVTYPQDGADAETLIKHADFAMYHAKESGRDNRQFFKSDMNWKAHQRQSLENNLRHALERGELMLYYQPKIDLQNGFIVGVEALVRWLHPDLGFVPPAEFIPLAEECGLMLPIGQWVRNQACNQAQAWRYIGFAPMRMAVNVSAAELRGKNFARSIRSILTETGLEPRFLELELTETCLMQDSAATLAVLQDLKELGLNLALDDFGTGYSSLSHLKRFPIDTLKIDRSFIRTITSNPDDASIVSAVIGMGRNLQMQVVAEGIETHEQLAFLQDHECPIGQGYYFSEPLLGRDLPQLFRRSISGQALQPEPS